MNSEAEAVQSLSSLIPAFPPLNEEPVILAPPGERGR